jgi:phenylalanyl-tRNA synthetase beta chain
MKFSFSWLKEHLETDVSLDEIVERLTSIGLEVDTVEDRSKGLETFVVGHVLEAKQHPNADRLRVCQVDNGSETVEVVCGAPNARTGLKGVFAAEGSYIPGTDMTLKKTEIRGVASTGMLLSEREMNLSDDHDGIIELPDNAPIGAPAIDIMGLNDPVIDIEITPNRGDCLGVRGIARDLAATGIGALKPLGATPVKGGFESPIKVHLDFEAGSTDACPYFMGRYIKGVKNVESPGWLKDKLTAVGLQPISALVDITNYMSLTHCRPLHVFDADTLKGDIHVRLARAGEKLQALDDEEYTLDADMTVIADDEKPEALAGVMGGVASGCTETTTNVFLETAFFDPIRTAKTGRKLNLQSDARFRFERGVDPAFLGDATEIATQLILDICGGAASKVVVAGAEPAWQRDIDFRLSRVKSLAGVDISTDEQKRILDVLGFSFSGDGETLKTQAPSWRSDIVGEACLVEEIIRINGLDEIPAVALDRETALPRPALTALQQRRIAARRVLAERGLIEAVTVSFMDGTLAELFGEIVEDVRLVNPISSDLDVMRPSILPNLIQAVSRNSDRGIPDACLYEVGPQFSGDGPGDQAMMATGILSGKTGPRNWAEAPRAVDAFDAKAHALAALAAAGAPVSNLQVTTDAPDYYHPGRSGVLCLGPKNVLARFGEIHPGVLRKLGVKNVMVGFEVFLDSIPQPKAKKSAAKSHLTLSQFQPVERDFAFVVDVDTAAGKVVRAAMSADKSLITAVNVFDVFVGGSLGEGKKSLAVNVTLQPVEKTLTDADIDNVAQSIVASVKKATGGTLRG